MPSKVIKRIIQVERRFFWSGDESKRGLPPVKWEIIQKSKRLGGLGIDSLVMKNAAMLFKWWWRYSIEKDALWKRTIISTQQEGEKMSMKEEDVRKKSGCWKDICNIKNFGEKIASIVEGGRWMRLGRGDKIKFWEDLWVGDGPLKERFNRLFLVSLQKESYVSEMGIWEDHKWEWRLKWRRRLFVWEEEVQQQLMEEIAEISPHRSNEDYLRWKFDGNGIFSVHSFVQAVWEKEIDSNRNGKIAKLIWQGFAPPRAELMVWFVVLGKLNTRDRLRRLQIISQQEALCPFCKEEDESINHLFFTCYLSWKIWSACCEWWNVIYVTHKDPVCSIEAWMGVMIGGFEREAWATIFFVIIWSIWYERNLLVNEKRTLVTDETAERIKFRLGTWIKAKRREFPYSLVQVMNNLPAVRTWRRSR